MSPKRTSSVQEREENRLPEGVEVSTFEVKTKKKPSKAALLAIFTFLKKFRRFAPQLFFGPAQRAGPFGSPGWSSWLEKRVLTGWSRLQETPGPNTSVGAFTDRFKKKNTIIWSRPAWGTTAATWTCALPWAAVAILAVLSVAPAPGTDHLPSTPCCLLNRGGGPWAFKIN